VSGAAIARFPRGMLIAVVFIAESLVPAGNPPRVLSLPRRLRYNSAVICIQVFRFPFWEEAHER
jgi:hypothetical protein